MLYVHIREKCKVKKVIAFGTFDLLQYEHINLLEQSKSLGDYLIVSLSTNECSHAEGEECYFSYEQRKELLEAIRYVDLVIPADDIEHIRNDVQKYHVDTLVTTDDHIGQFDFLKDDGVNVIYLPFGPTDHAQTIKNNQGHEHIGLIELKSQERFVPDPNRRKEAQSEFREVLDQYSLELPSPSPNDHYYDCEIDENTILVVGLGVNVRGNMQYILNELNTNERYKHFKIFVRTKPKTDDIVKQYIKQNHWTRTKTVVKGYNKKLESCKYLITESYFPYAWIKKEGQVMINLWHGTPLKRLGLDKQGQQCHLSVMGQKTFLNADYILCPNDYTKDRIISALRTESLLNGKGIMLGYPRTGGLLAVKPQRIQEIREQLAPNGERVYAYMPTFRGYLSNEEDAAQKKKLLDYLDTYLQEDQILYVNLHHKIDDHIDYSCYQHVRQFPPLIDSYELMTATDALISDYSSVFLDYLVLGKQIILYFEDYDVYEKDRGFYFDLRKLPFDIAESEKDVLDALNLGKQYDDTEARRYFCSYDTPESAKKIAQLIISGKSDLQLINFLKTSKKKVLVYTYCAKKGESTELLYAFSKIYDKNKYNLYLSCDSEATDLPINKDSAYPMMAETPVIGTRCSPMLSSMGQVAKALYLDGKISFEKAISVLKYDYALMPKRMYGTAQFDAVMIYDISEPEMIIGLSLAETECKYLFLQKEVFEKIACGDQFLQDAVKYASKYCNGIFVPAEEYISRAERIVDQYWTEKIQVVDSPIRMSEILNAL